ncbi:MAG: hypothetical protein ACJAVM_003470 [Sulfitobacter sp.]|jgi:hypothetical protein
MTGTTPKLTTKPKQTRAYPKIEGSKDGAVQATCEDGFSFSELMGMKTEDAAKGILLSAINALGQSGESRRTFACATFAELEPLDAAEAMLIAQMTATHTLVTVMAGRIMDQTSVQVRESQERSMTRLSRTYLAQMDALKKYRAKAQQVLRVERVTVQDGGQAIVGDVNHRG